MKRMEIKLRPVGILGTGSYLHEKIISNYDLEKLVDTSDDWIVTRTGIRTRHVVDKDTATSDLATQAAKKALEDAGVSAEELDLIIVATVTPDMAFPSTACILQNNIDAYRAAAFDVEAACSGFLYCVTIAQQFIATGMYDKVLVVCADTLSKITDWSDRNTCVLFGDGAGAVVLGPTEDGLGILSSSIGADGKGGKFLTMPAGGSRMPSTIETVKQKLHYIKMEGSEVFKFAARVMAKSVLETIAIAGYSMEDINYFIPHQANIRIIKAAVKKLKLSMDKVHVNLDRFGNMSAASIPVALDEAVRNHKIKKEDLVVMVGFGGGLTWGSLVIRWNR
jgi:3-oxoacyl-[acyl-carrier-protein] synthase-3